MKMIAMEKDGEALAAELNMLSNYGTISTL